MVVVGELFDTCVRVVSVLDEGHDVLDQTHVEGKIVQIRVEGGVEAGEDHAGGGKRRHDRVFVLREALDVVNDRPEVLDIEERLAVGERGLAGDERRV